jgi:tetratricopeptide (TPR) repeat protein
MIRSSRTLRIITSISLILSALPFGTTARGQDIVSSDDIAGGSSVFVFRNSRKKPQERSSAAKAVMFRSAAGMVSRKRVNAYVAANWRYKRVPALRKTTGPASAAAAARRRIALSNTLTANADKMLDNKQTDQAIATYREALKQNPKNTDASLGLSDALTAKGIEAAGDSNNIAGAVFLEEAVHANSNNSAAYAKLGEIYDTNDLRDKAIASYEAALKLNSGLTAIYVPLGIAYFKAGEIAKAETLASKAEALGQESADTRYLRGLVQFRQNKNDEALASFERAIAIDSDFVNAYYYRGQVLDRLERDDQAVASYKQAVAKDPEFAPAWHDMGVAYYNTGHYQDAVGAYQEAIKYDSTDAQAHANLASSYRQLEKYPEANKEYWAASTTIKNDPDLHSEWGYCLGKTNEWDKAVAQTITARQLSPTPIDDTNVGWAYYNAAQADKQAKKDADAAAKYELGKAFLQKAVAANPRFDAAYLNLGSTYNALGDYPSAVNTLNQAVSLHADWVIALNQLGIGYRGMNNLSDAAIAFNRVLTLDGNNLSGLFYLGEVQYSLGNKKEAKRLQQRLNSLNPTLAGRLSRIVDGKEALNEVKDKVRSKIPIPRIPF